MIPGGPRGSDAIPDDAVQVAVVGRPHGVRGEMRVHPESGDPSRLERLEHAWLRDAHGDVRRVRVVSVRAHAGSALLRLEGVADRDLAQALVHAEMWALRADLPPRTGDEFAVDDVVGAELFDGDQLVGVVRGVATNAGRDYFEVEGPLGTALVPAVREWLVAREPGRIVMRLPPGLFD